MKDFFEEHAIEQKVGDERPYIPYEKGDSTLVRKHWPDSPKFAARIARQDSGIIIPRYAPVFLGLKNVPAELRPDSKVVTSSHHHYHGDDTTTIPTFPSTGKPLPKRWRARPEEVKRHIEKAHGGVNVQTVHLDENRAKYVFSPGEGAKRLDIHPKAWPKFVNASRIFFGIEGCIKADAMLSKDEAVFSVPSVTLWRAPELGAFTRRLKGKVVYIVPDADWYGNNLVITQALFCRTFLRKLGVDAHVAAPPIEEDAPRDATGKLIRNGVDDFLYYGGTMNELDVLEREAPYGLAEWLAEQGTWRKDRVVRGAEVLEALALHAGADGEISASLRSVASIMGVHHSRVVRALRDLEECGAVEVEGQLKTHSRHYDRKAGMWVGWDWIDRPTITIVPPKLRAKDSIQKLGEHR